MDLKHDQMLSWLNFKNTMENTSLAYVESRPKEVKTSENAFAQVYKKAQSPQGAQQAKPEITIKSMVLAAQNRLAIEYKPPASGEITKDPLAIPKVYKRYGEAFRVKKKSSTSQVAQAAQAAQVAQKALKTAQSVRVVPVGVRDYLKQQVTECPVVSSGAAGGGKKLKIKSKRV